MPNFDAYFGRIGYKGPREPTLDVLNRIIRGHACSIPFENIDVLLGHDIKLDPGAVEEKLIRQGRGGYCFEQNGLLLSMLSALGFRATPVAARVGFQVPRDLVPPRTHVFLRLEIEGVPWLADVGIGGFSPPCAIQLDHDGEQEAGLEPRRIVRDGYRWFHQIRIGEEWSDLCQLANWWTSTNPDSKFRQNLMVARAEPDGARKTIQNREFTHRRGALVLEKREIRSEDEMLSVLTRHFDLNLPSGVKLSAPNLRWADFEPKDAAGWP